MLAWAVTPSILAAQRFDDFLRTYEAASPEARPRLVEAFVAGQRTRGGFPIVEPGSVVFFYAGSGGETGLRVVGDFRPSSFSNVLWDTAGDAMTRVGSVFYKRRAFEPDALIDYALVVDGKRVRDPLNPRTIFSAPAGGVEVSELVMPGHPFPRKPWSVPGWRAGRSRSYGSPGPRQRVTVYLPPLYDPSKCYPTLYTADGSAWVEHVRLPVILDNLIADGAIEPVIAVLIDPGPDRSSWYSYNPDYLAYLRRVVEHVDRHYSTRRDTGQRLHAGSSAGRRATAYAGLEMPDLLATSPCCPRPSPAPSTSGNPTSAVGNVPPRICGSR